MEKRYTVRDIWGTDDELWGHKIYDSLEKKIVKILMVDDAHSICLNLCVLLNTGRRTIDELESPLTEEEEIRVSLNRKVDRVFKMDRQILDLQANHKKLWQEIGELGTKLVIVSKQNREERNAK